MIELLYAAYYGELQRYLHYRTGDASAAEDVTQETFLKALQNADKLCELSQSQCRAWLYRTAKNLMIDRQRHMAAAPRESFQEGVETDFSVGEVKRLLNTLSPRDRELFYLRYYGGYNASELASMYGLSPANVRMRLKAARKILKKELE